jgi:uncharacterized protein DUF6188
MMTMSGDIWSRWRREREKTVAIRTMHDKDVRVWELEGLQVLQVIVDPAQVSLVIASGYIDDPDQLTVIIENDFTIRENAVRYTVDPRNAESLVPVLRLLSHEVASVKVTRDGSLAIRLRHGAELFVTKDLAYESWHTFGRGAFSDANMLCSPHEGPPWAE